MPESMQGTSLAPLLRGEQPAAWRPSVYYRYYHDPGHHNTRAHYGVRTATHKLIHYWKKGAWEMYDLVADPATWPKTGADGPFDDERPLGRISVAEAIAASRAE